MSVTGSEGDARGSGQALERWLAAKRWQRRVEGALARFDLSFFQWLVLDCLAILHRETSDAVSQVQVSRRLELGKASISRLMMRLDRRGLVDIAPAYTSEYRIYLTDKGKALLAEGSSAVELVSRTAR